MLSIAAGVTLATLDGAAGPGVAVVRAMPNTPALIGAGAAAISPGASATEDDLDWAESLLVVGRLGGAGRRVAARRGHRPVGLGPGLRVPVRRGPDGRRGARRPARDVAVPLAVQTLLGSARLLAMSSDGPEALRAAVTSPGGTTAEGLRVLEQRGVRAAVLDAVVAARDRSRELGG